jgi:hypothetical protein
MIHEVVKIGLILSYLVGLNILLPDSLIFWGRTWFLLNPLGTCYICNKYQHYFSTWEFHICQIWRYLCCYLVTVVIFVQIPFVFVRFRLYSQPLGNTCFRVLLISWYFAEEYPVNIIITLSIIKMYRPLFRVDLIFSNWLARGVWNLLFWFPFLYSVKYLRHLVKCVVRIFKCSVLRWLGIFICIIQIIVHSACS